MFFKTLESERLSRLDSFKIRRRFKKTFGVPWETSDEVLPLKVNEVLHALACTLDKSLSDVEMTKKLGTHPDPFHEKKKMNAEKKFDQARALARHRGIYVFESHSAYVLMSYGDPFLVHLLRE